MRSEGERLDGTRLQEAVWALLAFLTRTWVNDSVYHLVRISSSSSLEVPSSSASDGWAALLMGEGCSVNSQAVCPLVCAPGVC